MKTNILTIWIFSIIVLLFSCDNKESLEDNQFQDTTSIWRLEITLNGNLYKDFLFSYNEIFEENIYLGSSKARKIEYEWNDSKTIQIKKYYDSSGFIFTVDSFFYDSNKRIKYQVSYYYTGKCKCLYNPNIYILFEYNEKDFPSMIIQYDSTNYNYLTQTFVYDNQNNVIEKNYPLETGLPQYKYEYDSKNSFFHDLNLPRIDELAISKSNITRVTIKQQYMTWNDPMVEPEKSISEEILYYADFTYDSLNYPLREIRRYSTSKIDTFEYKKVKIK